MYINFTILINHYICVYQHGFVLYPSSVWTSGSAVSTLICVPSETACVLDLLKTATAVSWSLRQTQLEEPLTMGINLLSYPPCTVYHCCCQIPANLPCKRFLCFFLCPYRERERHKKTLNNLYFHGWVISWSTFRVSELASLKKVQTQGYWLQGRRSNGNRGGWFLLDGWFLLGRSALLSYPALCISLLSLLCFFMPCVQDRTQHTQWWCSFYWLHLLTARVIEQIPLLHYTSCL